MEKIDQCEMCSAESKYIYKEKELCSDCVTKLAQKREKNYFWQDERTSEGK